MFGFFILIIGLIWWLVSMEFALYAAIGFLFVGVLVEGAVYATLKRDKKISQTISNKNNIDTIH